MPSLEDYFRALKRIRPPEEWHTLEVPRTRPLRDSPELPEERQRQPRTRPLSPQTHRVAAGAVAITVAAAGIAVAIWAFGSRLQTSPIGSGGARNGRIAYVSHSGEGAELWVVNPDGTDPIRLVGPIGKLPSTLADPFWTADGTRLGYNVERIGSVGIEIINADGTGRRVITPESLEYAGGPEWSPDGKQIAFFSSDRRRGSSIFVMNADGTDVSRLTGDDLSAGAPSWSPDGTKIAFVVEDLSPSDVLNNHDVYVMNSDGSDVQRLTEDPHLDLDPDWSPDGTEIVFRSRRDPIEGFPIAEPGSPPDEIYVMNADGTEPRRLTVDEAVDQNPVWSPDGTMIAFHSLRDGSDGIYVMNADGSGIRRVASGWMPAWQPLPPGDARVAETPKRPQNSPGVSLQESVAPSEPGAPTPAVGTGSQTVPQILKIEADALGDPITVTNRNDFDWSECNVQLDTRLNELDPFEHPTVPLIRSGESVVLSIERFERHMMTSEVLTLEAFGRFPWKRLILVCETPEGSASGRVEWGQRPEPPYGPGAVIGVAYPFNLYTHCGVLSARFDGREWNADPPLLGEPAGGNPPPGWGNPYARGTMTLLEPDLAEFRSNAGHVARFRPRPAGEPDPAEGCA